MLYCRKCPKFVLARDQQLYTGPFAIAPTPSPATIPTGFGPSVEGSAWDAPDRNDEETSEVIKQPESDTVSDMSAASNSVSDQSKSEKYSDNSDRTRLPEMVTSTATETMSDDGWKEVRYRKDRNRKSRGRRQ